MGSIIWYRLKCFLRNRNLVFWTLCFPIILGTIFNFVLKDIQGLVPLETIEIAVVDKGNEAISSLVKELGDKESENYILDVTYANEEEAHTLLMDGKVTTILYMQENPYIEANQYGYDTTILKSVINSYTRVYSQVEHLANKDPMIFQKMVIEDLFTSNAQIQEIQSEAASKDMNMIYFYNIIAMVCMYGMLWGVAICNDSQATQSKQAARVNVSPLPKLKMLAIDFGLCYTMIVLEILFAIVYLNFGLGIMFGEHILPTICIILASTLTSLSLGMFVGTFKLPLPAKIGMISGVTVLLNFFAGMMASTMPYMIQRFVPIMMYINPADLIVRAFSMMYYYSDLSAVYVNASILVGMGVVFLLLSFSRVRRVSYASL